MLLAEAGMPVCAGVAMHVPVKHKSLTPVSWDADRPIGNSNMLLTRVGGAITGVGIGHREQAQEGGQGAGEGHGDLDGRQAPTEKKRKDKVQWACPRVL